MYPHREFDMPHSREKILHYTSAIIPLTPWNITKNLIHNSYNPETVKICWYVCINDISIYCVFLHLNIYKHVLVPYGYHTEDSNLLSVSQYTHMCFAFPFMLWKLYTSNSVRLLMVMLERAAEITRCFVLKLTMVLGMLLFGRKNLLFLYDTNWTLTLRSCLKALSSASLGMLIKISYSRRNIQALE